MRARLMLAGLTLMPWEASHIWQCCSRVASGWVLNCSTRPACNATPLTFGRPGMLLGTTWPLSRRCLRYRLMLAMEMAKVSATSACFFPWSIARRTRCRKSCEYAFMFVVYHRSILMNTALVEDWAKDAPEHELSKHLGEQGWELISYTPFVGNPYGTTTLGLIGTRMVFKPPKAEDR